MLPSLRNFFKKLETREELEVRKGELKGRGRDGKD